MKDFPFQKTAFGIYCWQNGTTIHSLWSYAEMFFRILHNNATQIILSVNIWTDIGSSCCSYFAVMQYFVRQYEANPAGLYLHSVVLSGLLAGCVNGRILMIKFLKLERYILKGGTRTGVAVIKLYLLFHIVPVSFFESGSYLIGVRKTWHTRAW